VTRAEAVRLIAALAQCEIAMVRRDPVAGPLLAQAARAADGLPPGPLVAAAAAMWRRLGGDVPPEAAAAGRKVAQALCRAAVQETQAVLLGEDAHR
jgi:hypothetical protein